MSIQSIAESDRPEPLGVIRLGYKVKTQSGAERPENADHFVITDAPMIEAIYGKQPKEIDVIFLSDDLNEVIPSSLVWWKGSKRDARGKLIGQKRCQGNGPDKDGNPGVAKHFDKMNHETGVVPERPCLGSACPDWEDSKGNPQCKPNMQVFVLLPKIPWGIFTISTTSWTNIRNFYSQLNHVKKLSGGKLFPMPFKLFRYQKAFPDGKGGTRLQWVMGIRPNLDETERRALQEVTRNIIAENFRWSTPQLEAAEEEIIESDAEAVPSEAQTKVSAGEALLADADVQAYFTRLEQVLGAPLTAKDRLIKARKCEGKPDPKKALLDMITKEGKDLAAKTQKAAPAQAAPAAAPAVEPPPAEAAPAGGLI